MESMDRILNPDMWDAVFPVIAFVLVIVVPIGIAGYVIYRTLTERDVCDHEI